MTVDEKVARLWGKLRNARISGPPDLVTWCWSPIGEATAAIWQDIPDPAVQPWEWVKVLEHVEVMPGEVLIQPEYDEDGCVSRCWQGMGDTPELALAAAIDKMAKDVK